MSETYHLDGRNVTRRWNGRAWEYPVVDHINGDPRDNSPENLRLVWLEGTRRG